MRKRTLVIYSSYIWLKVLFGLIFNPYLTIKKTLRRPILFPVLFTPILGILILLFAGRIGAELITIYGVQRDIVALFLSTLLFSILMWQLLLLYLLTSLLIAAWRNE